MLCMDFIWAWRSSHDLSSIFTRERLCLVSYMQIWHMKDTIILFGLVPSHGNFKELIFLWGPWNASSIRVLVPRKFSEFARDSDFSDDYLRPMRIARRFVSAEWCASDGATPSDQSPGRYFAAEWHFQFQVYPENTSKSPSQLNWSAKARNPEYRKSSRNASLEWPEYDLRLMDLLAKLLWLCHLRRLDSKAPHLRLFCKIYKQTRMRSRFRFWQSPPSVKNLSTQ